MPLILNSFMLLSVLHGLFPCDNSDSLFLLTLLLTLFIFLRHCIDNYRSCDQHAFDNQLILC